MPGGRSGWPPDGEYPEVAQLRGSPEDDCREETQSPRVKLVDAVLQLQKDLVGLDSPRRQCPGMQGGPVGTSIGIC